MKKKKKEIYPQVFQFKNSYSAFLFMSYIFLLIASKYSMNMRVYLFYNPRLFFSLHTFFCCLISSLFSLFLSCIHTHTHKKEIIQSCCHFLTVLYACRGREESKAGEEALCLKLCWNGISYSQEYVNGKKWVKCDKVCRQFIINSIALRYHFSLITPCWERKLFFHSFHAVLKDI
jgi:hypothetical protein